MTTTTPSYSALADAAQLRRDVDQIPDVYTRLVAAQLSVLPPVVLAATWVSAFGPDRQPGRLAIVELAVRVAAPQRIALQRLRQQHGDHLDAIAQLRQVLELEPDHQDAAVFAEAIAQLEVMRTAAGATTMAVHRG